MSGDGPKPGRTDVWEMGTHFCFSGKAAGSGLGLMDALYFKTEVVVAKLKCLHDISVTSKTPIVCFPKFFSNSLL